MKPSLPSAKKLTWLFRHPVFQQKPLRTLGRVFAWEIVRLKGAPIRYTFDDSLPILLYPNDGVARLVYYFDYHEPLEFAFLNRFLTGEMVCLDIGANIGLYSLFMAKRASQVVAFEPYAQSMSRLRDNVLSNSMANVTTVKMAVSDRTRKLALCLVDGDSAKAYTTDRAMEQQELVDALSIDEYFSLHPLPRLDYIKIDAEGAEGRILAGAMETLRRFRPLVQMEVAPDLQLRFEEVDFDLDSFFRDLSYTSCTIDPTHIALKKGRAWTTIAVPNDRMEELQHRDLLLA